IRYDEVSKQYPDVLRQGDSGIEVANLQFFIDYLSAYYNTIPSLTVDGSFGAVTEQAVRAVQRTFGLPVDGVVGEITWEAIYDAYLGIVRTVPPEYVEGVVIPFPGVVLRIGADSPEVRVLQEYLNVIAEAYPNIPTLNPTGYFGNLTRSAVTAFQNTFGLEPTGTVGAITWNAIANIYESLFLGSSLREGQYPGFEIG
ncbi:MAG: peptidoglycan-binding protein, partial [Ruminococcaceae bacterium]|nr:peptidoglycan-binding protein [Oscillospiraceae bacterium]